MNKKLTGIVIDALAVLIWGIGSIKLYRGEIPFIWDGIAYYAFGLVAFVAEESLINIAAKRVIQALIGRLGRKD